MKKMIYLLSAAAFIACLSLVSCGSNKTGCKVNDNAHVKMDRNGELPTKRGKSRLFPKKR